MVNDLRRSLSSLPSRLFLAALALVVGSAPAPATASHRATGVDVSEFQGTMNWNTTVGAGIDFAFIRSTRGGTTGSSTGSGGNTVGAGRYDDPRFATNIAQSKNAGLLVAPYHYGRPDTIAVVGGQPTDATVRAAARDEAAHFVQVAGNFMTAGYLRPVLDLEERGGSSGWDPNTDALTATKLTLWANTFMDEVFALKGVEPIIYMNTNYAQNYITATGLDHRDLWIANWEEVTYGNPVTGHGGPPTGQMPGWSFWQYSSTGTGSTYGASSTFIDLDVANGDVNFVRSFLIPEPGGATVALLLSLGLLSSRRSRRV